MNDQWDKMGHCEDRNSSANNSEVAISRSANVYTYIYILTVLNTGTFTVKRNFKTKIFYVSRILGSK